MIKMINIKIYDAICSILKLALVCLLTCSTPAFAESLAPVPPKSESQTYISEDDIKKVPGTNKNTSNKEQFGDNASHSFWEKIRGFFVSIFKK